MKDQKIIIFLNLRFSNFFSKGLFKQIKEKRSIRFVAIIDQQFKNKIEEFIKPYLDEIIYLPSQAKNGFLAEFLYDDLRFIVEKETKKSNDVSIVCFDEFNLLNAGKLRREFNIIGHTDECLLLYRDKVKMKAFLFEKGIRVPKFKLLNKADQFENLVVEIGLPFVIKPIDSCGSYGVYIINQLSEFIKFKQKMNDEFILFEVEEFIKGTLYHVDTHIKANEIKFICASEYSHPNHDYTQGKPLSSIPLEASSLSTRLIAFARHCLFVLKTNNMVNHMELFVTHQDELVFLEISARPPGALLNLTHQLNFGINLTDEDFFMQSGLDRTIQDAKEHDPKEAAFFALFPLQPGKVIKLNQPQTQSRVDMTWCVSVGDMIPKKDCDHIVGKAAYAIFYHTNKKILRDDFELIKHHQAIEVVQDEVL